MNQRIGLTIFVLTVAFYSCNCTPGGFRKIGSHETISYDQKTIKTWYFTDNWKDWHSAKQTCSYNDMELTYFSSRQDKDTLSALYHAFAVSPWGVWVGYTDQGHEGRWTNIYGASPSLSLEFQAGEPTNSGGDENCLHMDNINHHFTFNDANCGIARPYICHKIETVEIEMTTKKTSTTEPPVIDPRLNLNKNRY